MIDLSFVGSPQELREYIGREICEDCLGEGVIYESVLVHGSNLSPEGVYDFEPKTCHCRMGSWNDRTEEQ